LRLLPEPVGKFHFVVITEEEMKLLQRLGNQIIYRKPDRPPPIGIAAEHSTARLGRLVINAIINAVHGHGIWMFPMVSGKWRMP
jgi:hypothetical protein